MHTLQFWVSGVRISPLSPMETERKTKILRPTARAVNAADGEEAQRRDLFCFVSIPVCGDSCCLRNQRFWSGLRLSFPVRRTVSPTAGFHPHLSTSHFSASANLGLQRKSFSNSHPRLRQQLLLSLHCRSAQKK